MTRVIQVTNIAPQATKDHMANLFGFLGKMEDIRMYPRDESSYGLTIPKVCFIKFAESATVGVSQHLTNTVFIDRAIIVMPVSDGQIPEEDKAMAMGLPTPGMLGVQPSTMPANVINQVQAVGNQQVITTIDPRLTAMGLPPYPPLPGNTDPSKVEEIRRTVYVGNLDTAVSAEALLGFFQQAGEVKYVRMAGDESQATRYSFIEFTEQTSIANALQFNGVVFGGRPLKVNHSTNSIVKPQAKSNEAAQREIEEAMKRVREAQSLITAAIEPDINACLTELASKDKDKRSRSRSHSKSRSRHGRSRSRSRKRSHSRHRSRRHSRSRSRSRRRSHSRRSRSRSRGHRRRSRSRSRRRSRSPRSSRREKQRSVTPRNYRYRSRSRSRDRAARTKGRRPSRSVSPPPKPTSHSPPGSPSRKSKDKGKEKRSKDRGGYRDSGRGKEEKGSPALDHIPGLSTPPPLKKESARLSSREKSPVLRKKGGKRGSLSPTPGRSRSRSPTPRKSGFRSPVGRKVSRRSPSASPPPRRRLSPSPLPPPRPHSRSPGFRGGRRGARSPLSPSRSPSPKARTHKKKRDRDRSRDRDPKERSSKKKSRENGKSRLKRDYDEEEKGYNSSEEERGGRRPRSTSDSPPLRRTNDDNLTAVDMDMDSD